MRRRGIIKPKDVEETPKNAKKPVVKKQKEHKDADTKQKSD